MVDLELALDHHVDGPGGLSPGDELDAAIAVEDVPALEDPAQLVAGEAVEWIEPALGHRLEHPVDGLPVGFRITVPGHGR